MSVRLMTTEALQKDLNAAMVMWGGGIPPEQNDRVNALRGELKRRGADATPQAAQMQTNGQPPQVGLRDLDNQQLQAEMDRLASYVGKNPNDEEAQTRWADARYEMRNRTKASNGNGQAMKAPLPDNQLPPPDAGYTKMVEAAMAPERMVPRREVDIAAIAERNAAAMKDIEQAHIKLQQAQVAAIVAARLISEGAADDIRDVDGDQIAAACDIGVAVATATFTKLGLIT